MKGIMQLMLILSMVILLGSCASNRFQFRKNFHQRVAINPPAETNSGSVAYRKKEADSLTSIEIRQQDYNEVSKMEIIPMVNHTKSNIFHISQPQKKQWAHPFNKHKILKVNKTEKVQSDTAGLLAVVFGAIAILFLLFGFALFHVSLSLFWTFWVTGFKLGLYSGIYGLVAVSDDDDWSSVLGLILGCLAIILAFVLIAILLL